MSDDTTEDPTAELEAARQKLETAERQINDYKLVVADYENARKRTSRDNEQQKKYSCESLCRDLLMALDNLDRALASSKQAGEKGPLVAGVSATASQFLDIFRRYGVTRIECAPGSTFDPNQQEAVNAEPTNDFEPGQVVRVLSQGFMLHDRVLRPASVVVAAAPPAGGNLD